jgi:hypothetical protein
MTIDIDERKVKRNEFSLWLAWTLATTLGMLVGYLPLALLVNSLDLGFARVAVPIITGVLLGISQWLVLRPYLVGSYNWVFNHATGWAIGYTLGLFVVQWLARSPIGMMFGYIAFGVIISLFQYPILHHEVPHLFTWLVANVIGWTAGAYLSLLVAGAIFQKGAPTTVTSTLVIIGVTGLVAGAFTALALILIVRQPDLPADSKE